MSILRIALVCCIFAVSPALAHEGTAGEHLILGLDSGILIGFAMGFFTGALSLLIFQRHNKRA